MKLNRRERVLLWVLVTYALLVGCAHQQTDFPACRALPTTYEVCEAKCPGGRAFIVENASDVACYCSKKADGT